MKKIFSQSYKQHNGFVLLFALVVSAIIFFIGAGIFSISFKELLVSSISKESQKSIFAADSGVECGLWADTNDLIGDSTNFKTCFSDGQTNVIVDPVNSNVFDVYYPDSKTCAHVEISSVDAGDRGNETTIIAQGYNKCNPENGQPIRSYAGLAERVYKVSYFR
jgi:hypothetical protein